jgi:hypothetical protein
LLAERDKLREQRDALLAAAKNAWERLAYYNEPDATRELSAAIAACKEGQ